MAILFGTTAEGETLPVEVNEFGQLVAEGLPGEAGPPGPPGLPELPPNPSQGDVLVWENDQLSWGTPQGGMEIKSIQRGVVAIQGGKVEIFAAINFVDPAKSLLSLNGFTLTGVQGVTNTVRINLDSGSRIYALKGGEISSTLVFSYELVEYS